MSGAEDDESTRPRISLEPDVFGALEATLLGQAPHLTRPEVIEQAGVTYERAHELWLSLGFSPPSSDEQVMFTDADVEAVKVLGTLVESGLVDSGLEFALTRSMGRSFARLAEWEISEVAARLVDPGRMLDMEQLDAIIAATMPHIEQLQNYVWRRHLASAAGRLLLNASAEEATEMAVGFADVVGYTRRTRSLSAAGLAEMVERFESTVTSVISNNGGRIIKTIGDEVLFVCDDPHSAARIAMILSDAHQAGTDFPQVRIGLAHGRVLSRLGDVFGEVVNVAARLTSIARPGRVLVDRSLADAVREHDDEFRVRRAPNRPVRGYSRLEAWALKPPKKPSRKPELQPGRQPADDE